MLASTRAEAATFNARSGLIVTTTVGALEAERDWHRSRGTRDDDEGDWMKPEADAACGPRSTETASGSADTEAGGGADGPEAGAADGTPVEAGDMTDDAGSVNATGKRRRTVRTAGVEVLSAGPNDEVDTGADESEQPLRPVLPVPFQLEGSHRHGLPRLPARRRVHDLRHRAGEIMKASRDVDMALLLAHCDSLHVTPPGSATTAQQGGPPKLASAGRTSPAPGEPVNISWPPSPRPWKDRQALTHATTPHRVAEAPTKQRGREARAEELALTSPSRRAWTPAEPPRKKGARALALTSRAHAAPRA
jgi:hypothetical protein